MGPSSRRHLGAELLRMTDLLSALWFLTLEEEKMNRKQEEKKRWAPAEMWPGGRWEQMWQKLSCQIKLGFEMSDISLVIIHKTREKWNFPRWKINRWYKLWKPELQLLGAPHFSSTWRKFIPSLGPNFFSTATIETAKRTHTLNEAWDSFSFLILEFTCWHICLSLVFSLITLFFPGRFNLLIE